MEAIGRGDDDCRAFKKVFNSNPCSSVHKVMSNEDLLIEILLLLPLISLNLFKRVSKHWKSIIKSPSFIFRRTQISGFVPPSGLFIFGHDSYTSSPEYDFLSFGSRKISKRSTVFTYNSEIGTKSIIRQSCNGLLLSFYNYQYFIYNPLISMFKMLPPIHSFNYVDLSDFRMAFDPTKSPHYKVVHVGDIRDPVAVYGHCIKIQTYSSETDVWTVWDDLFPLTSFTGFWNAIYSNGAIHWLNYGPGISYFKLEFVDRLVLTKIQTPLTLEGEMHDDHKLFGSYDSLLLVCKEHYRSRKFNIYEIKSGCSEWSIKYFVNLDNMVRRRWRLPKVWRCYNVWSIFCGEREEDSYMVIELSGKVLRYKFVSAAVTKLLDLGKGVGECDCHDFITSFAHV